MPKDKYSIEDRVPPTIPINWADWDGDEHVREMNETMEGIYFRIIREQWVHGRIDFDHNRLAQRLRCDRRNVKKFLEKWGHLFRCCKCDLRSEYVAVTPPVRSEYVAGASLVCSYCAPSPLCSCSDRVRSVYHRKLKFYRIDVNSGLPLGTTKQNVTEPNQRKPEPPPEPAPARPDGDLQSESIPEQEQKSSPAPEADKGLAQANEPEPESGQLANHLLRLLSTPAQHANPETLRRWGSALKGWLSTSALSLSEAMDYFTWAVQDNIDPSNKQRSSAEWIPVAKDPCATLIEKAWLLDMWRTKRKVDARVKEKAAKADAKAEPGDKYSRRIRKIQEAGLLGTGASAEQVKARFPDDPDFDDE
jgi:hypothetical protein